MRAVNQVQKFTGDIGTIRDTKTMRNKMHNYQDSTKRIIGDTVKALKQVFSAIVLLAAHQLHHLFLRPDMHVCAVLTYPHCAGRMAWPGCSSWASSVGVRIGNAVSTGWSRKN